MVIDDATKAKLNTLASELIMSGRLSDFLYLVVITDPVLRRARIEEWAK